MKKIWQRNNKRKSLSDNIEETELSKHISNDSISTQHVHSHAISAASTPSHQQLVHPPSTSHQAPLTPQQQAQSPIQYQLKRSISSLAKVSYDNKQIKNQWLNVVINSNLVDINENLKLMRVELRGSNLYLFKPASNLNINKFKLINDDVNVSLLNTISSMTGSSTPTSAVSPDKKDEKDKEKEKEKEDEIIITYYNTNSSHPDLVFENNQIVSGTTESIVHYILFNNDIPLNEEVEVPLQVQQIINILPLFDDFVTVLEYLNLFGRLFNSFSENSDSSTTAPTTNSIHTVNHHHNINNNNNNNSNNNNTDSYTDFPITTPTTTKRMISRIKLILENVHKNFRGLLLINKVFELCIELIDLISVFENIDFFKEEFFYGVRGLSDLYVPVENNNLTKTITNTNVDPLTTMNSKWFLSTDLQTLATTITSIDTRFNNHWNQKFDKSLLLTEILSTQSYHKRNPLIFNNNSHINYLARLLVQHILIEKISLETRAKLIEKWIELGCLLDKSGNMVSWLGISTILLSQGILRLTKIWSLVGSGYVKILKNDWSPVVFELDRRLLIDFKNSYHVIAPRGLGKIYGKSDVVPFFGDLIINNTVTTENKQINIKKYLKNFKRVNYSFNRWDEYLRGVVDHTAKINYCQGLLSKYVEMGVELSNESLNKLFFYEEESNNSATGSTSNPSAGTSATEITQSFENMNLSKVDPQIEKNLYKMIELNCESFNLEKIMKLSLDFEPNLIEDYLICPSSVIPPPSPTGLTGSLSSTSSTTPTLTSDDDAVNRLPNFNNSYFKINLHEYDDSDSLAPISPISTNQSSINEDITISNELIFKIDDFINDDIDNILKIEEFNNEIEKGFSSIIDVKDNDSIEMFDNVEHQPEINDDEDLEDLEKVETVKEHQQIDQEEQERKEDEETDDIQPSEEEVKELKTEKKLKLIPKYISLESLIDLLIIDSNFFYNKFNLKLNLNEFRLIFLLNYSSFTSTNNLLSQLTSKFITSKNVVVSIMKSENDVKQAVFPDWNTVDNEYEIDYNLLLVTQINILKTLIILIDNFYENFIIDLKNKLIIIDLLKIINNEILQWYNLNKVEKNIELNFEKLINYYKKLRKIFIKKTYRPIEVNENFENINKNFKFNNNLHEVPINKNLPNHKNLVKVEKFLNKFNNFLKKFYSLINLKDWFEIYKIFEIQFEKNSLLNFNLQKNNVAEENLIISNIFNYLETLYDPAKNELILLKFPIIFKKLFKLYFKFKNYLLVQLTDLTITVDERIDRMKTLLLMTKISKMKMSKNFLNVNGSGLIPSFIETALTNVIYSPESRSFTNFWIKASQNLNSNKSNIKFDELNDLLPKIPSSSLISKNEYYLPCFGWIIENLIEINKIPNFSVDKLINFNKRYLIFKFIKNLDYITTNLIGNIEENNEFEFLINLSDNLIDYKNLKEFNHLEKEKIKLFKKVINDEYKILRIDNNKKTIKENKIILKKNSNSSLKRQSINYKMNSNSRFKISGIFTKSRPFSLNVPAFNSTNIERTINSNELPNAEHFIDPKQKPFVIIPLKNKKIFPVYILPCCFKIELEQQNEEFFFQATSDSDLNDWLVKLNYANRHWFFSKSLNAKHNSFYTTFGIPIEIICNRENSLYPLILEKIFVEIETNGLKDIGIYRISPSYNDLNFLKSEIDLRGDFNFNTKKIDIHTLTSSIKLYFRELPDALITDGILEDLFNFKNQTKVNNQLDAFQGYRIILSKLPLYNYHTLKRLILHLKKVNSHNEENKMTSSNLATVIGPAITEPSSSDLLINNFGFINPILEQFINNYDHIFSDA